MRAETDQSDELVQALRQQLDAWQPLEKKIGERLEKLNRRLNKHQLLLPLVPFFAVAAYLRALFYLLQGKTKDEYWITTAYLPHKKVVPFDDRANTDFFQDEVYQTARRFLTNNGLSWRSGCGLRFGL